MGLRCLVGHDYGQARTSRDERARGNEVVVTVREYRECSRCGHQRVISENKEIKVSPPEPPTEPGRSSRADDEGPGGADPISTAGAAGGDAVEPMTAEEDDGIILEDEPERSTRARGEWPDAGREAAEEGPADAGADDEGSAGVEFGGGPAPEDVEATTGDGSTDAEAPGEDADIIDAEAAGAVGPSGPTGATELSEDGPASAGGEPPTRPDDHDTEFVCTECGETWPAVNASLRPGDICPECRRGYLTEQVAQ